MKKNNNVNVYGINIKTNPKEMVRLSNQLNYERYLFKKNVRTFESKDKYIINAETGFKYEDNFIGSNDEKKFFKVNLKGSFASAFRRILKCANVQMNRIPVIYFFSPLIHSSFN